MSETAPAYAPDTATDTGGTWHAWRCRECGREMWIVTDGDAWIDAKAILPGRRDVPVKVQCPHCGAWNEWRQYN